MLNGQHHPAGGTPAQRGDERVAAAQTSSLARAIAAAGIEPSQYRSWRPPRPQLTAKDEQVWAAYCLSYEKQCLAAQDEEMARRLRLRTLALTGSLALVAFAAVVVVSTLTVRSPPPPQAAAAPPLSTPAPVTEPALMTVVRTLPERTAPAAGPPALSDERASLEVVPAANSAGQVPDRKVEELALTVPPEAPIGSSASHPVRAPGLRAVLADIRQRMSERPTTGGDPFVRLESAEPALKLSGSPTHAHRSADQSIRRLVSARSGP